MDYSKKTAALAALALLVGGCGASGGGEAKLPEGETDLSCAAAIYAATNLLEEGEGLKGSGGFGNYVAVMTKYGTAHAKANGLDPNEVIGVIKVQAMRMTGDVPGGSMLAPETIVRRAKACAGS